MLGYINSLNTMSVLVLPSWGYGSKAPTLMKAKYHASWRLHFLLGGMASPFLNESYKILLNYFGEIDMAIYPWFYTHDWQDVQATFSNLD